MSRSFYTSTLVLALLGPLFACSSTEWPAQRPAQACAPGALPDDPMALEITVWSDTRQATVWHPPSRGPHDLLVFLHAGEGSARKATRRRGLIQRAQEEGAILVAPEALHGSWNAGECCGTAQRIAIDDVAMLDTLHRELSRVACTTGRVLVLGQESGGMLAHRWACDSELPDGLLSVDGGLQLRECAHSRPIPALQYRATQSSSPPGALPPEHSEAAWSQRNGARVEVAAGGGELQCSVGHGRAPVALCRVLGEPGWPGVERKLSSSHELARASEGGLDWLLKTTPEESSDQPPDSPSRSRWPLVGG